MWHRLKNLFFSFNTYKALSPDLKMRQQVNRALSNRPALTSDEWFKMFYQSQGIAYSAVNFVYQYLGQYSGLEMSRVLPADRLNEDLRWTFICWFDWETQFWHDVYQQFGVDMSECLHDLDQFTIEDLVVLMDQAAKGVLQKNPV